MTTRNPIFCALIIFLAVSSSSLQANENKDVCVIEKLPRIISLLSTAEAGKLLNSGISFERMRKEISSIPLTRIGPGYTLYFLRDGTLRIPISIKSSKQITAWKLSKPDGETITEQHAVTFEYPVKHKFFPDLTKPKKMENKIR